MPGMLYVLNSALLHTRLMVFFFSPLATLQIRSEFDELLLNHARASGATVAENTRVQSLSFSSNDSTRPISASWTHSRPSTDSDELPPHSISGTTTFDYIIDATGRAGLISTKYLKNRHFNASLKNIALWGYWKDVGTYGVGTEKEGSPWFEALTGMR